MLNTSKPDQCIGHNCCATTVGITGLCQHHLNELKWIQACYFLQGYASYERLALADIKDGNRPTK